MRKLSVVFLLLFITSLSFSQIKTGYEINISIHGLQDSTIFLAYHLGDKQYIKDTIKLDHAGRASISGNELLPQGIYMIVLPSKKYFEMLISTDQRFEISCLYSDYFNTLKFTGSDENSSFVEYQKKWMSMQQRAASVSKRIQANKQDQDSLKTLSSIQKNQEAAMKQYLMSVINSNNGNLLATLVKALLPIEVPEFIIPSGMHNPDSVRWVKNYNFNKDHFFDNIDLTDERLLRTPILYARLNTFFKNVVIQSSDSINKEIDKVIANCKGNYKVFQFVAVYLFNHFRESEIMGHDAVMVKLADDIYLSGKADWVSKEFKDDLRKQIELIRPNLIGKKAVNLIMDSYKGIFVSLYDVEKDFTILYFWEPDCGHCKEATPKLKEYYEKAKNENIEVFAVCTTADKAKWSKYIEDNKLNWINGWDPARSSHFDTYFNVQSTPMIYILDKNKKIIAKKLGVEDIGSFIANYKKYYKPVNDEVKILANNSSSDARNESKPVDNKQEVLTKKTASAKADNEVKPSIQYPDSIDIDIPVSPEVNGKTFALVIGNENYRNEIKVPFAINDATVFSKYCQNTLGIPSKNIHLLNDGTFGQMLGEFKWIKDVIKVYNGEAKIIIYYAGHGMPGEKDKNAYLLPIDGNSSITETAVKLDDLYAGLTISPSKSVFVFLDACFSGAARDGSLSDGRGIKILPKANVLAGSLIVFSATSADETALPINEKGHGLFTYYLLKKLKDSKGNITLDELSRYVIQNVKRQSVVVNNKLQNPKLNLSPSLQNSWQKITIK